MRPDRIIVGEVRGAEALDMLTALSTGHDGSLCTVHAGSPAEALRRVEVLALMSDVGLPHAAIREQIADAFDLVVCQARMRRRLAPRRLGRRGRPRRRGPGGARAVRLARRRARAGAPPLGDDARRAAGGRGVTCAARRARRRPLVAARGTRRRLPGAVAMAVALAFAAAAAVAVVAACGSCSRAVERTRRRGALRARRRAGRAGRDAGRGADDRGAAAARGARGRRRWPRPAGCVGGRRVAVLAGVAGPGWSRPRVVRARAGAGSAPRSRRAAPAVARALADALVGRPLRPRRARRRRGRRARRRRARARARAARALRARRAAPRRCSSACAAAPRSPAWDAMVAGILLQRDAGGDLPALLRDLARALEAAARQDRDAIAATAQARFTARIVLVLPVGAALLAELAQPGPARRPARQPGLAPG